MSAQTHSTAAAGFLEVPNADAVSDLLRLAIERHRAALRYFESTCYLDDTVALGREPTEEEQDVNGAAGCIEEDALAAVCSFPSMRPADLAAKARHLLHVNSRGIGGLTDEQVALLLRSLTRVPEAAEEWGGSLFDLLDTHASLAAAINAHPGEPDHPEVAALLDQLNETAVLICGYRPLTTMEERRKAEFLEAHFEHNVLSEDEQDALIGSLMLKGGAA